MDAQAWGGRGKLLKEHWAQIFGRATVYGMSPLDFLRADPLERQALLEVAEHTIKAGVERDRLLANRIIVELGEAMKRTPRKPIIEPDG